MVKKLFSWVFLFLVLFTACASFAGSVRGYYRKNGTYVQPYQRSNSNSTVRDNYSYKGNVNPSTGKVGTNYYRDDPTSEYYGGAFSGNVTSGNETIEGIIKKFSNKELLVAVFYDSNQYIPEALVLMKKEIERRKISTAEISAYSTPPNITPTHKTAKEENEAFFAAVRDWCSQKGKETQPIPKSVVK